MNGTLTERRLIAHNMMDGWMDGLFEDIILFVCAFYL
jgi:hypothetical protein